MKFKKWIPIIIASTVFVTLTGCHGKKKVNNDGMNDANAAYNTYQSDAQTSGAGQEASFGEQQAAAANQKNMNRRVYYFNFDSSVVHDEDKPAIDANAEYLASHQNAKIMLEGHTDPRGSREYNVGLGERRAKAVAHLLTARGVSPAQIRIVSYGAEKLAVPGHTETDYQQDRRVVLVYLQR